MFNCGKTMKEVEYVFCMIFCGYCVFLGGFVPLWTVRLQLCSELWGQTQKLWKRAMGITATSPQCYHITLHDTARLHHENCQSGALGFTRSTLSMVISFNLFIARDKSNTRTNVDWNQMLYYRFKPFLYIQLSRHRAVCVPTKGTLISHFKGSRNKFTSWEGNFVLLSVCVHCSNRMPLLQASDASICHYLCIVILFYRKFNVRSLSIFSAGESEIYIWSLVIKSHRRKLQPL